MKYVVRIKNVEEEDDDEMPAVALVETQDEDLHWAISWAVECVGVPRLCQFVARFVLTYEDKLSIDNTFPAGAHTLAMLSAARGVRDAWEEWNADRNSD